MFISAVSVSRCANMAEATDSQELVPSLKQLIIGFGPYLRQSGSVEQAEDSILHMEENDENFHRYIWYLYESCLRS